MAMPREDTTDATKKFVVYILEDGRIDTHGGPYPPMKAREVTESMQSHVDRGDYASWNIPEETETVEAVTREKLRVLRGLPTPDDESAAGAFRESDFPDLDVSDRVHLERQNKFHGRERVVGWLRAKVALPRLLELAEDPNKEVYYEALADHYLADDDDGEP